VLFQGGQPVVSKWAAPSRAAALPVAVDDQLAAFEDPFLGDLSIRAVRGVVGAGDYPWLSTSGGLPAPCFNASGTLASSSPLAFSGESLLSSAIVALYSPRGPPVVHLAS
jgi:hypothetical protein